MLRSNLSALSGIVRDHSSLFESLPVFGPHADGGPAALGPGWADAVSPFAVPVLAPNSYVGTTGDDTQSGTDGNDTFDYSQGGNDTLFGNGGNDGFYMGAAFNAGDHIDGGDGNDFIYLTGDYSGGLTLTSSMMTRVENFGVDGSHNYNVTSTDSVVPAGGNLEVYTLNSTASSVLMFNGSAETDGTFYFFPGNGTNIITGGAKNDTFDYYYVAFSASNQLDGGAGYDVLDLNAAFTANITFGPNTIKNIETIFLNDKGSNGGSYNLTTSDGNVAAGATLFIDGSELNASHSLTFYGAAETDGAFIIQGGAGNDLITDGHGNDSVSGGDGNDAIYLNIGGNDTASGGAGNDYFFLGSALTASDQIDGGADSDTVELSGNYSSGLTLSATTMVNVEYLALDGGHNYNITTNDATVAAGGNLELYFPGTLASDSVVFNASAETDGTFYFFCSAGTNIITGGAKNDTFDFYYVPYAAGNKLDGGGGYDILYLNAAITGTIDFGSDGIKNIEYIGLNDTGSYDLTIDEASLAGGTNLIVDGSALTAGHSLTFTVTSQGAPVLAESGATFKLPETACNLKLGSENDTIEATGNYDAALDVIDGGGGNNKMKLNGDYLAHEAIFGTGIKNVPEIDCAGGHSYKIYFDSFFVTGGNTVTVDASGLQAADVLIFDGTSVKTGGRLNILGGAGNDTIATGDDVDVIDLRTGGKDVVHAGAGDDRIDMGAALISADRIDGGSGSDTVTLDGDYASGLTLGSSTLTNVEKLQLGTGSSYKITTNDATVASGQLLTVTWSGPTTSEALTFKGSDETNGSFKIYASAGKDVLIGGAGNDTFDFTGVQFTSSNLLDGGAGSDLVVLDATHTSTYKFAANTLKNIEFIHLDAGGSYAITTNDANVAAGMRLTIGGEDLGSSEKLTFNGAAETDGSFTVNGGAGNDSITGGARDDIFDLSSGGNDIVKGGNGNDIFNMGAALTAGDRIDGGDGVSDDVVLDGDYSGGLTFKATTMINVETLSLMTGHSYRVTLNDANVAAGQVLTVESSTLGAGDALTFVGSAEKDGRFVFNAGAGNDTITAGSGDDLFLMTKGGTDAVKGGAGNDSFQFGGSLTSADKIDGGIGTQDQVTLDGDYSTGLILKSGTMINVETLLLTAGHSYKLTTNDATVAAGQTLTVEASSLGSGNAVTFNGSAETDGHFVIEGGLGGDVLTGGALADTYIYTSADHSTSVTYDTINGFNFSLDRFHVAITITAIDTALNSGKLDSGGQFDTELAAALSGNLGADHAILFTASSGNLSGQTFLVVDLNGSAGYQAGADLVIHMNADTGTLVVGDFI
jgi:Ca2+-binding RTX toxin-like protein